jgi:hypothetical protein
MTTPTVTTVTIGGKRHYEHPITGQQVPSVTSIIGVLDKPALPRWAAKEVAAFAVDNKASWVNLPDDAANDMLKAAPWRMRDKAADTGTNAHSILEMFATTGIPDIRSLPPGVPPVVVSGIAEFWLTFNPQVIACEQTVWNSTIGYAGSFDLIAVINGKTTLIDLKTGAGVYGSTALQLAAYAKGEEIITNDGTTTPMPVVEEYAVLHVPQNGKPWALVPMNVTDQEFNAFMMARGLFAWVTHREKPVVGKRTRKVAA